MIQAFPAVEHCLGKYSALVHSPDFDNAVAKIQLAVDQGKSTLEQRLLSSAEKAAVAVYALDPTANETEATSEANDDEPSFIEEGRNEYDSKRPKRQIPYRSVLHILPTSNIVECLFSRCGIIMRPHRRLMDPSTLEMLVQLHFNRELWDEKDVDAIMIRTRSAHVIEPPTPTSCSQSSVSTHLSTSSASR